MNWFYKSDLIRIFMRRAVLPQTSLARRVAAAWAFARTARLHAIREARERFDNELGVETGALADVSRPMSALGEQGGWYEPTPASLLRNVLKDLLIDPSHYTFVDLGSGKGRALIIAAEHGFARVVGIEIDSRCHQCATRNLEIARSYDEVVYSRIALIHGDVDTFSFDSKNILLYFFNAFALERLLRVIRRAQVCAASQGGAVRILSALDGSELRLSLTQAGWRHVALYGGAALYDHGEAQLWGAQ